jgi:hypothetical protein
MRLPARFPLASLLGGVIMIVAAGAGCSSDSGTGGSASSGLNIGLNNQSNRRINVVLTINGHAQAGISVNQGAYVTDEFPIPSGGGTITIDASSNDGNPVVTFPTKVCNPTTAIMNTAAYGQIDFTPTPSILCQDPATWE